MKKLNRALLLLLLTGVAAAAQPVEYVPLTGGVLRTALPPDGKQAAAFVSPFFMRIRPVSNAEFLAFVTTHPKWRRDGVPALFADQGFLSHWAGPDEVGKGADDQPVTQVSWFAAEAFCEAERARLPTWHEWELVAAADASRRDARSDPAWRARILSWYSRPSTSPLPKVGQTAKNVFGVYDMHGVVWEWVQDYAGLMVSVDNRVQGDPELQKFCGAGALSVSDRENYAVLMRIAMLSSLKGADTTRNLGFRCARDGDGKKQEKSP